MIENIYDCSNNTRPIKYQSYPQLHKNAKRKYIFFLSFLVHNHFRNIRLILNKYTYPGRTYLQAEVRIWNVQNTLYCGQGKKWKDQSEIKTPTKRTLNWNVIKSVGSVLPGLPEKCLAQTERCVWDSRDRGQLGPVVPAAGMSEQQCCV